MKKTALLIIDVQNDYFPGGKMELAGSVEAAEKISDVLAGFRASNLPIIHIQHESVQQDATFFLPGTPGQQIHPEVQPLPDEKLVIKNFPNSFLHTDLLQFLHENHIHELIITGMMTFMCVDATTRAAIDQGFVCTLVHDCTASPAAEFGGISCSGEEVRAVLTRALSYICKEVVSAAEILDRIK